MNAFISEQPSRARLFDERRSKTSGRMSRVATRDGAQRSLLRRAGAPFEPRLIHNSKKAARLADCFFLERMTRLARLTRLPALRHAHGAPKSSAGEFLPLRGCSFRASSDTQFKKSSPTCGLLFFGADDEARTRYLHLGKVALYRMSYIRMLCGFVNVYIIHTDRTVVKHYFPFFTVGITRRASKMTSDIRTSPKNSQARPNKSRAYFIFTFTVPFR